MKTTEGMAFDRASVRSIDKDGRLHVELSNISKATISAYVGKEVPRWRELGLDPDRIYQFLRDPEELKKAVLTFNNLPLLSRHVPVTADNHRPDLVVGSTGTDAEFIAPYLKNSIVIWAQSAIDGVESGDQKELSSAYYWRADMTPGVFEGARYDGVMRDIIGNHIALVEDGRAGPDVVVGDSNEEISMAKTLLSRKAAVAHGALLVHLAPLLAQDAKIDLTPYLAKVTNKNFKTGRDAIVAGIAKATKGKLAQDAALDLEAIAQVLEALEGVEPAEDNDNAGAGEGGSSGEGGSGSVPQAGGGSPATGSNPAVDADPLAAIKEFLKGKISDEDLAKLDELTAAPAQDGETEEEKAAREAKEKADMDKSKIDKPAMDAAIAAAVTLATKNATDAANKAQRDIREAEKFVQPWVGELLAQDSAEAVERAAAVALKIPGAETVHASALRALISMVPKPGAKPVREPAVIAQDAASIKGFASRFPEAGRIGRL